MISCDESACLSRSHFVKLYYIFFSEVEPYAPVLHTLPIGVPFPPSLLAKPATANGSIHASSIISTSDERVKEILKLWFEQALAHTEHFDLAKPELDENQALQTPQFMSFKDRIEQLGYTVWDIQTMNGETVDILLEDTNHVQRRLSGRADFLISSPKATIIQAASQHAVCVVEKQSKPSDEDCEHQLLAYMVILMNRFGLLKLAGILLYSNGTCRAYRASRNVNYQGMYEENDTFMMYQLPDILPSLLNF